jgi:outer membrane immunogenic protein
MIGAEVVIAILDLADQIVGDRVRDATAGWAVGDIDHTNTDAFGVVDTFSAHRSGLAAGGGIAYAITNNLIGKIEYRYYDLGTYHRDTPANAVLPYNVANTYSTVLLGLDFKFGGSPVVAKY